MTSVLRYRENVIGACGYLTTIDGKTVEAQSRVLMVNMRKMRLKKNGSSLGSSSSGSSAGSVSNTLASSSAEHSSSSQLLPNVVPSDIEPPSPAKSDRRTSDIVISNDKEDDDDEIYDSADDDDESVSEAQEYDPEAVETAAADDFSSKNIKEER